MSYEMLVGLQVSSDEIYNQYREAMAPILSKYGGKFRYDFKIAEVLKKDTVNSINRVFVICFADKESKIKFFVDSDYVIAKEKFFEKSVTATTIMGELRNE